MKRFKLITFFIFLSIALFAQEDQKTTEASSTFTLVEAMPEFPGGNNKMNEFIVKNIKYPKAEKKKGLSGICYVTFVIDKDGSVAEVKLLRGIQDAPGYNEEALRVVRLMPKWSPGTQEGKPVRVQFNLPIKFTLRR